MGTKKSLCFLMGLFVIIVWSWGFATPALSETIKCKSESDAGKREVDQVLFTEYFVGSTTKEMVATCDNGETPTVKMYSVWDATVGKENFIQGYSIYTFKDSSKIVTKFNFRQIPDPEGKAEWISDSTADIIKGTLRFNGIKGNVSSKSKTLHPDHRGVSEFTITYTLPPK